MDRVEGIAKEISLIAPRWIRTMQMGYVLPQHLTMSQVAVLFATYEQNETTTSKLSKTMRVSPPTISGIVDRLVRDHYLQRFPDKKDRRVIRIQLTKKGVLEVKSVFARIQKKWKSVLILLSPAERETFLGITKKIVQSAEQRQ
ncbi:MarR family winged helix-turn-helix transcriptional regulator [Candidatus Omnitrophota bacterium]